METRETMRQAIIDAIEKDEVSKRDLMDTRSVNKIIAGTVKDSTIELAYSRLAEAKEKHKAKNPSKLKASRAKNRKDEQLNKVEQLKDEQLNKVEQLKDEQLNKEDNKNKSEKIEMTNQIIQNENEVEQIKVEQLNKENLEVLRRIDTLELEVKRLREENQDLKTRVDAQQSTTKEITKEITKKDEQLNKVEQTKDSVLGFSIRIENTWTQGKQYSKYYAIKRIAGKHYRIYLGKDTNEAEKKIKAYCERHSVKIE